MISSFYQRLHSVFEHSERIAYVYYDEQHTYGEMYTQMRRINTLLHGIQQKKIVLYGTKNFPVYSALYAILLSNNIWVPVTPGMPSERLIAMLEVLVPDIILYEQPLPDAAAAYAAGCGASLHSLAELVDGTAEKAFEEKSFLPDEVAYIMFTSGSTGLPKGVPMTHLNYINFINNALALLPLRTGEVFSDYHDFAFDISIFYLFCAPLTESALSPIKKPEERMLPLRHMQKNGITVWSSVPSMVMSLQRFRPNEKQDNRLNIMFLCGEPLRLDVLRYCFVCLEAQHIYNFYGLTETGVENFYHTCSSDDIERYAEKGFAPIGLPLPGNDIQVTGERELLLGGCQLTPGYLGNIGKERFELVDGKLWYHTGDIVEEYGGVYFCKGRLDTQVKLSGYRVELMDIEVQVRRLAGVKDAVCFVAEENGIQRLVCAVQPGDSRELSFPELTRLLKALLPEYMVPKKMFSLSRLPLNKNGKIDRRAVKEQYQALSQGAQA